MPVATTAIGISRDALLDSHEARLQKLESMAADILGSQAGNGARLESITLILKSMESKLESSIDVGQDMKSRIVWLEGGVLKKDKRLASFSAAFLMAFAGVSVDIILKVLQHAHLW